MKKSIKVIIFGGLAAATIASGVIANPANAVSPLTVTVSKTTELSQGGEMVTISISNIPTDQGVYVYQCASNTASPRPASTVCRTAMSDSLWVSTSASSISQGATDASLSPNFLLVGAFTVSGTTYDCTLTSCGIFIRRDHLGSGDFSLDALYPIDFKANPIAAAPSIATSPVTEAPVDGSVAKIVTTGLRQIEFGSGAQVLTKANKKIIKSDIATYQAASRVVITATAGITPGATSKVVKSLAKKRANAIKKYLVSQDIAAEKIVIKVKVAKAGTKPSTKIVTYQ